MSENVAKFLGIENSQGRISPGHDADIIIWDPEEEFEVKSFDNYYRHQLTPYEGKRLKGVVKKTFVRGCEIYSKGKFLGLVKGKIVKIPE